MSGNLKDYFEMFLKNKHSAHSDFLTPATSLNIIGLLRKIYKQQLKTQFQIHIQSCKQLSNVPLNFSSFVEFSTNSDFPLVQGSTSVRINLYYHLLSLPDKESVEHTFQI